MLSKFELQHWRDPGAPAPSYCGSEQESRAVGGAQLARFAHRSDLIGDSGSEVAARHANHAEGTPMFCGTGGEDIGFELVEWL